MNLKILLVLILVIILAVIASRYQSSGLKNVNENQNGTMKIESDAFVNNGKIPAEYTCNGAGAQPPLKISGAPKDAKSLALLVDDPDAPGGDFVHWVVWNIDPATSLIENGRVPGAEEGYTSLRRPGWVAPCPPSGVHHYNFKIYALDTPLSMPKSSAKADLLRAMEGHVVGSAILLGLYGREN